MPNVQFVCPHCEKHAEAQVASVTRTRTCPHCGYNVLLQVHGKVNTPPRRALLVTPSKDEPLPLGPSAHQPGTPAYLPQPLEGDPLDRMRADPEIHAMRRQLITGLAVLAMLIVATIIWHFVAPAYSVAHVAQRAEPPDEPPATPAMPATAALRSVNTIGATRNADLLLNASASLPGTPGKLSFFTPGAPDHATGDADAPLTPAQEKTEQARKVLAAFLSADSVDTLLATVAYRATVEPEVRSYYATHPLLSLRVTDISPLNDPLGPAGGASMLVTLSSGRRIQATVLAMDDRHFGVDWPSFVALSDMEWSSFINSKPTTATLFRVFAETGDWYDNSFADPAKLQCVKLTSPTDPTAQPLFVYAERFSSQGRQIESLLRGHTGPLPLTLRLRFPQASQSDNQALLDSVVSSTWVILPESKTAQVGR